MKTHTEASLAPRTTLRIGGTARLIELEEPGELDRALNGRTAPGDLHVLGRGSNVLFPDRPLERPVLHLTGAFEDWSFHEDGVLRAGAAVYFPRLAVAAAREGWSGLEWAAGVPGTVGGAVAMNAGAFGDRVSNRLRWVRFRDADGEVSRREADAIQFDYRYCELRDRALVLEAAFVLEPAPSEEVLKRTRELMRRRRNQQPVGDLSAGCIFRNPEGASAGELIDRAGLKGASEGAIAVSDRHANYFVNRGGGTATEVLRLMDRVRRGVQNRFDVELELELQVLERP